MPKLNVLNIQGQNVGEIELSNAVGVEVICDEYVEKGVDFAAKYTYDNAVKVLKEAWPEVLA